jgi:hypothetical protein
MMRVTASVVVLLAFLCLPGCSSEPSRAAAPSVPGVFAGTWSGDILVQSTPARMTWALVQSGDSVTGNVVIALTTGIVLMNGSFTGTASGAALTYTIAVNAGGIPLQPACTGQLGGTATASSSTPVLLGSYTVISSSCSSPLTGGSFELTKRS